MGSFNQNVFNSQQFGGSAPPAGLLVSDLIYRAYRIAGLLTAALRGVSPSESTDGLLILNSMIDSWRAERLMVYEISTFPFQIESNKVSYTIGPGADIDTARPVRIDNAGLVYTTSTLPAVEVPLYVATQQEWEAISPKLLTSTLPYLLYYSQTIPSGTIYLWPVPIDPNQVNLYLWSSIQQFASTDTTVIFPPKYQEAVEYNLAIRLAAQFPTRAKLSPIAVDIARSAIAGIKSINSPELMTQCELATMGTQKNFGHWNILSNSYISGT